MRHTCLLTKNDLLHHHLLLQITGTTNDLTNKYLKSPLLKMNPKFWHTNDAKATQKSLQHFAAWLPTASFTALLMGSSCAKYNGPCSRGKTASGPEFVMIEKGWVAKTNITAWFLTSWNLYNNSKYCTSRLPLNSVHFFSLPCSQWPSIKL